ncbi:uncharacterized protein LOC125610774 isoform X1 [Marmota marmota marmota]|uniref:uncharacterized protein LOC125610774 isoform X1 n=1 Tax=Marmota marmota marmota TaxID=9994 RepID=UPI002093AAE0|nr:uncharacterized protein LOC125610774 isoform X1 [Marmota marmota marmota]
MVTKPRGVLSAQQPCPHSPWRDSSTAARGGRPGISCPGGATPYPLLEQPRRPRQGSASSPRPGPGGLEERGAALGRSCWLRSEPSQGGPAAPRTSPLRPAQEGLLQFRGCCTWLLANPVRTDGQEESQSHHRAWELRVAKPPGVPTPDQQMTRAQKLLMSSSAPWKLQQPIKQERLPLPACTGLRLPNACAARCQDSEIKSDIWGFLANLFKKQLSKTRSLQFYVGFFNYLKLFFLIFYSAPVGVWKPDIKTYITAEKTQL